MDSLFPTTLYYTIEPVVKIRKRKIYTCANLTLVLSF